MPSPCPSQIRVKQVTLQATLKEQKLLASIKNEINKINDCFTKYMAPIVFSIFMLLTEQKLLPIIQK